MTGFGTAHLSNGKFKILVEIKSVNHRFLDIAYYLPQGFSHLEEQIRPVIQSYIQRGRITFSFRMLEKPGHTIVLNKEIIKKHLQHAATIQKEFNLKNDLTLSDIINLPGVLETREIVLEGAQIWPSLEKCVRQAMVGLVKMRNREGKSLSLDIGDKLKRMTIQAKKIEARSKLLLQEKKKTLSNEEFSSFQRSNDVNEEISRLKHFISELKDLLRGGESAGKKVDFIGQEMQRETNTIGSKLQDKEVLNAVIALKSKIEKIREQAQNIE